MVSWLRKWFLGYRGEGIVISLPIFPFLGKWFLGYRGEGEGIVLSLPISIFLGHRGGLQRFG